jgi:putative ABC transport system substrate-binding protein
VQQKYARELLTLAPDVVLAGNGGIVGAVQRESRTVPIIFTAAIDPVGSGRVASLVRPGGNATGFLSLEYGMGAKLLELLREVAPRVVRIGVIRDTNTAGGVGLYAAIVTASSSLRAQITSIENRDEGGLEREITDFARAPNGGLIVAPSTSAALRRKLIISLAARHNLPAVYPSRAFVEDGGLISYGGGSIANFRLAAGYVDRILKGEKPADLPVQAPTKYEMVVNLNTAKALGLTIPETLLATADEVIQ